MIAGQRPETGELKTEIPPSISKDRSKKNERNCHEDNQLPSEHDEKFLSFGNQPACGYKCFRQRGAPDEIKRDADQAGKEQPHFGNASMDRQREGTGPKRRDAGEQRKGETENDQLNDRVLGREALVAPEDGEAEAE
jgi:hypothetical protein